MLPCMFLVALWSPAWQRADLLAVVFCHFHKCVLVLIRIKGEVGAVQLV